MNIRNKLILMLAIPITALVLIAGLGFRTQSAEAEKNEDAAEIAGSIVALQDLALEIADERLALVQATLAAADPTEQAVGTTELEAAIASTDAELAEVASSGDPLTAPIAESVLSIMGTSHGTDMSGATLGDYTEALNEINTAIEGIPLTGFSADAVLAVQAIQDAREVVNTQEDVWIQFFALAPVAGAEVEEGADAEAVLVAPEQVAAVTGGFGRVDFVSNAASKIVLSSGETPMIAPATSSSAGQLSNFQALAREDLFKNTVEDLQPAEVWPFLLINRAEWNAAIQNSENFLTSEIDVAGRNIDSNRSLFTLFAVLGSLLLVTLIFVIGRSILGPLGRLMEHADVMTQERLPFAVAKLRTLGASDELPEIRPIPKEANDEIGSLVDAFNDVQETAVKVATDQARSRRNVAEMFVSLGRRNQQLNHRMINLITDLERDEQDPDTLAGLYQLDHLATRMRRNAESLLVLAGNRSPRQWSRPVPVEDVIRSSITEVELFERVEVGDLPELKMQGNVVTDVTHLLAELLDNATQFSEPSTSVSISAVETLEGVEIEVFDEGFGINEHDLVDLNERISNPPALDEAPSRLLGLFVVGRLSQQHGIDVELQSQPGVGTVATVALPSSLFAEDIETAAGRIEAPAALAGDDEHDLVDTDFGVDNDFGVNNDLVVNNDFAGLDALAGVPETVDSDLIEEPVAIDAVSVPDSWVPAALHEEDLADASMPTMEEVEQALPSFPGVTIDEPAPIESAAANFAVPESAPPAVEPVSPQPVEVSDETWPLTKLEAPAPVPPVELATSISELDARVESHAAETSRNETAIPDLGAPSMSAPVVEPVTPTPVVEPAPEPSVQPVEQFSVAPPLPEADEAPTSRQLPAPPIVEPVTEVPPAATPAPAHAQAPPPAAPAPAAPAHAPAPIVQTPASVAPAPAPVAPAPAHAAAPAPAEETQQPTFGGLPTRAPMATLESEQVAPELIPLETATAAAPAEESPNKSASAFAAFATGVNRGLSKVNEEPESQFPSEGETA